jgi:hypothetical protein
MIEQIGTVIQDGSVEGIETRESYEVGIQRIGYPLKGKVGEEVKLQYTTKEYDDGQTLKAKYDENTVIFRLFQTDFGGGLTINGNNYAPSDSEPYYEIDVSKMSMSDTITISILGGFPMYKVKYHGLIDIIE